MGVYNLININYNNINYNLNYNFNKKSTNNLELYYNASLKKQFQKYFIKSNKYFLKF